jgi:hypothetical protein
MIFYEACNEEGVVQWIVAHEQTGEHRMFGWLSLSNKGRWYRNTALEEDFYSIRPSMTFRVIDFDNIQNKLKEWPSFSSRKINWLIKDIIQAESKTSEEIGLF